jgi:TRAP-type mannitol/chloroaromatic compound transport system permease small subunit
MEQEILQKLNDQQVLIDKMYKSVEKMRKYFLWTFILSLVFFILPLIAMIFVLPSFINTYMGSLGIF